MNILRGLLRNLPGIRKGLLVVELARNILMTTNDIQELEYMKKAFQDQVTDPQLNWQGRMKIYEKVQQIVKRIDELKNEEFNRISASM